MNFALLIIFLVVSLLVVSVTLFTACRVFRKNQMGEWLALAGFGSIGAIVSYIVRILCSDVIVFSWMTTFHLLFIDFALFFYILFILCYTGYNRTEKFTAFVRLLKTLIAVDSVFLFINPFKRIVVDFVIQDPALYYSKIVYATQYPLYYYHIALAYLMVVAILLVLWLRISSAPKEFRAQYSYSSIALTLALAVNVVAVFVMNNKIDLNFSVCLYCVMVIIMYVFAYRYGNYIMLNYFKESVFENVGQGIVLFDFNGEMIMRNMKAVRMLSNVPFGDSPNKAAFNHFCNISFESGSNVDSMSFQCFMSQSAGTMPLRCNFRKLRNEKGIVLGYLYIFVDMGLEVDAVSGFHNWNSFKVFAKENEHSFNLPLTVIAMEMEDFFVVNGDDEKKAGLREKKLAEALRSTFPKDAYYVHGEKSKFFVLAYKMHRRDVAEKLEQIQKQIDIKLIYALDVVQESKPNILDAINAATTALNQKRMSDEHSGSFTVLNSLIRAMRACDSDIDGHIERMKRLCSALGERLELTDKERSDLDLLCMFHDVGKIGVPAAILNKINKLSREEWRLAQTHTSKGCQIARSTKELSGIAELILHHHERWDGKGYPGGLSRESIPKLSRIVNIVASYDAMTNSRSFRGAMTPEVAIRELRACAGTQFDPAIVSEFLQVLQDMGSVKSTAVEEEFSEISGLVQPRDAVASMMTRPQDGELLGCRFNRILCSRYILDEKNKIVSVDENFENLTGYSRDDLRNIILHQEDLIPAEDLAEYLRKTSEIMVDDQNVYFEHRLRKKDGSVIYVFCMGKEFIDVSAREKRRELVVSDCSNSAALQMMLIEEKEKSEKQLRQWEDTYRKDSLTGVLNRSAFQSDVEEKLLDENTKVMLLMVDVDKFKNFNDTYGHRSGDECLISVARAVQGALRGTDLACRMGGDEFAAALFFKSDCTTEFMYSRAQQIFDKISKTLLMEKHPIGLSMGAVVAENSNTTFRQLYEASDKALYKSKESGRGCLSVGN